MKNILHRCAYTTIFTFALFFTFFISVHDAEAGCGDCVGGIEQVAKPQWWYGYYEPPMLGDPNWSCDPNYDPNQYLFISCYGGIIFEDVWNDCLTREPACIVPDPDIDGCMDPNANNFDPFANIQVSVTCTYDVCSGSTPCGTYPSCSASDCAGTCGGSAIDYNGAVAGCGDVCTSPNACGTYPSCFAPSGCNNQCGSSAVNDCAGICGGSTIDYTSSGGSCGVPPSSCTQPIDCAGICGGSTIDYTSSGGSCGVPPITYTYTYNTDGGLPASYPSVVGPVGTNIPNPGSPTKASYSFAGWSPLLPTTMKSTGNSSVALWTLLVPGDCPASIQSNCSLPLTSDGLSTAGTCTNGTTGSCNYRCSSTLWSQNSNSCVFSTNNSPNADAGDDRVIRLPVDSLSPSGQSESDPDGTISSRKWDFINGSTVPLISNSATLNPSFLNMTIPGTYTFRFEVTDNQNAKHSDDMFVSVLRAFWCNDSNDNDGDGLADINDPGCHTDGNASNATSYDPSDDSEPDSPTPLGGSPTLTATKYLVKRGESVQIKYNPNSDAVTCTLSGGTITPPETGITGTTQFTKNVDILASTTYTLNCGVAGTYKRTIGIITTGFET